MSETDRRATVLVLFIVFSVAGATFVGTPCLAQIDIETIVVYCGPAWEENVAEPDPYFLEVYIVGTGISAIDLSTPNGGGPFSLFWWGGDEWGDEIYGYSSLAEMRNDPQLGFGNLLLEFYGPGGASDSATVFYDPGNSNRFTGFPLVTSPEPNEAGVDLSPTLHWTCSAGTCGPDGFDVELYNAFTGNWITGTVLDTTTFQWTPGPLDPNTTYWFDIGTFELIGGTSQVLMSTAEDSFEYFPIFEAFNSTTFHTNERIELFMQPAMRMAWTTLAGVVGYDIVRGDLQALRTGGGNFAASGIQCVADDHANAFIDDLFEPGTNAGVWYLVRGVSVTGGLSYESMIPSQVGQRDAEIDADAQSCP
jgi:hypothetical protein